MDDPSFAWGPRYSSNEYPERAFTPLKHDYFSTHSYPPSSDFDVSEYSEDVDHDIPKVDSEPTSDSAPSRNSVFFSDAEEEEDYENDEFNFGHGGYRTTFFRTSAERSLADTARRAIPQFHQWKHCLQQRFPATAVFVAKGLLFDAVITSQHCTLWLHSQLTDSRHSTLHVRG